MDNVRDNARSTQREKEASTVPSATTTVQERARTREQAAPCGDIRPAPVKASRLLRDHGSHSPNGPAASRNAVNSAVNVEASTGRLTPQTPSTLRTRHTDDNMDAMKGKRFFGCGIVTD